MRAILIDPKERSLSEVQIGKGIKRIQRLLQCRVFTTGAHLGRTDSSGGYAYIYASDDLLDERDETRFWFQVDANNKTPTSYPIAGRGLAIAADSSGEACDLKMDIAELTKRITFTERVFRGFDVQQDVGPYNVIVRPIAPVIDKD